MVHGLAACDTDRNRLVALAAAGPGLIRPPAPAAGAEP
jgi:hypothetical protein